MRSTLSVRDVCARCRVSEHTVLSWIARGELRAFTVGRKLGAKKPRWRITHEALEAFEQLRTAAPPAPRARRRKQPADVVVFY